MTIFSLGNACDLELFSSNTKLNQENFENKEDNYNYQAPVVPMPTEPPFQNTNYTWKSESSAVQQMTTRGSNNHTFQPSVGSDSNGWGSVNFGPDYWGEGEENYSFKNKLLNNSSSNRFNSNEVENVMPNARPQGAFMPPARSHIVNNEDMNGRDTRAKKRVIPKKVEVEVEVEPEVVIPPYNSQKIEEDQKRLWFFILAALIIIIGTIMYKTNYF